MVYSFIPIFLQNSHIHAFYFADTWKVIIKNAMEGGVYIIKTFIIRDTVGNLKAVSTDICIRLTNVTTFQPCPNDVMIHLHKFEFFDLHNLFSEASRQVPGGNPEFAIGLFKFKNRFPYRTMISIFNFHTFFIIDIIGVVEK